MRKYQRHRGGGFTLAEVLLASAILAIMVTAVTQTIVSGQAQTYDALYEERALALGEALMEEVLARPYADPEADLTPGPDAGEDADDRSTFDAVDDFANYTEAAGALVDAAGVLYPDAYQAFERSVAVTAGTIEIASFGIPQSTQTVEVTVAEPDGGRSWVLTRIVPEALQ